MWNEINIQKVHLKVKKNINDLLQTGESHAHDVNTNDPIWN